MWKIIWNIHMSSQKFNMNLVLTFLYTSDIQIVKEFIFLDKTAH